ncbi:MAG: proline--tRNA ligase [Gemmatimonadetes bacterium]|nr:proline--tRNA ligase [Gemmatimonadota bacterium]
MTEEKGLTPRAQDFAAWYNEVVLRAELADYAPVRGCMVIRPYGYAIWELVQRALDEMFKQTGHQNAYFPLFIPQSYLAREAEHIEGFAPETAVVTLGGGKELEEPLVVRPTSEAIIWPIMAKWIQSYRDLPVLVNQWCNVVRWEMRTRPFLRTTEFLWQEGHTAHATEAEAEEEARRMLGIYRKFMEEGMAMPVLTGRKTEQGKFAGALRTYSLEALMQDNRALQAGTTHNLGQNFARAFEVTFQNEKGERDFVWNTSWGVSTRLIGALVMSHGDDLGLVLPPRLAPVQVVIVPIYKADRERALVLEVAQRVSSVLQRMVRVRVDDRETLNPGAKYYEWDLKGVPLRIEIGPRDVTAQQVVVARRFVAGDGKRKITMREGEILASVERLLEDMQRELRARARQRREENSHRDVTSYEDLKAILEAKGGFVYTGWCGSPECEDRVKEEAKADIRVIPDDEFRSSKAPERCPVCGAASTQEVVWAKAY